jgi:hypothetical protein
MPKSKHFPHPWENVWAARAREPARRPERAISPRRNIPSRVVTVKGILVFWKAALFAGRRRNEGLGRSVRMQRYPPLHNGAPITADVRRSPRRGTSSACATKRMHPSQAREIVACAQGRVLRSVLRPVPVDPHYAPSGAIRSVVGRSSLHHGWANPRKWEEPALGLNGRMERGSPRVTASARERACHVRKGRRSRPPSLRGSRESGFYCSHVVFQLQRIGRRLLASNKLGKRAPKRAVRVE